MDEFKVGDFVAMKTCKHVTSADEMWEVTATDYPLAKWPRLLIRNVADFRDNPRVASQVFDVSLLRKVL